MRIEAHAGLILDAYKATPDITLAALQALLADHGTEIALGTTWRFYARREEWFDEQLIFIDETWAERHATNDCGPAGRTDIGKPPPSLQV